MTEITISRDKFEKLLELAEEALDVRYSEFSSYPTPEECDLMTEMHELVGKPISDSLEYAMSRTRRFEIKPERTPDDD